MDSHLRQTIPAIGEAIGLRNAIHTGYDGIDTDLVWTTIVEDLDPLRRAIEKALYDAGEPIDPAV